MTTVVTGVLKGVLTMEKHQVRVAGGKGTMVSSSGAVLAEPSTLGTDGASFQMTYG